MGDKISDLSARSLEIFRELVDAYIETGEAVGSRLLSKRSSMTLSSATIRNIMADLEDMGLLYAEHTSAGRIPTEYGLRFFVNELLEISDFNNFKNDLVSNLINSEGENTTEIFEKVISILSGLSQCAGIISAPKTNPIIRKIDFILLGQDQLLIIIVSDTGQVENRIIQTSLRAGSSLMEQLSNYTSNKLIGHTLSEGIKIIEDELLEYKNDLDSASSESLKQGVEAWKNDDSISGTMFLKGRANLLENIDNVEELGDLRNLFEIMETKNTMLQLLNSAAKADGIQVFIGSENPYFKVSGCSLILSPYKSNDNRIIGAIGIIGPAYMKYREVIPLVNYTSKIISKLLNKQIWGGRKK
ncbi:MAG: heat-inducible transcriptional repressor HrcA [Holosporales bacterium]|jgi:heat-inducible transcriptional repressor|nr:heat-inducible transcriptional repressor HrcA [Holosporales bacterium]